MAVQTLIDINELPKIVRDYISYKLTIQGRAKKTMDEYALDLRTFIRWLTRTRAGLDVADPEVMRTVDISLVSDDVILSVTPDEIYAFLFYTLDERHNSTAARARKLSALKSFYRYLTVNKHLVETDPTVNIEGPQQKKSLPKFLSLEESEALLDAVRTDEESKTRARDFCILTLFLNCGMRLSELCGIDLPDIDRNMESLRVTGKGSKERLIYLNDSCRDALRDWLAVRNTDPEIRDRNALFHLEQDGAVDGLQIPRSRRARKQVALDSQAAPYRRDPDVSDRKRRCPCPQGHSGTRAAQHNPDLHACQRREHEARDRHKPTQPGEK